MQNITCRVRNYTDNQGNVKGEFVKVGVLGQSQAGKPYIILDPTVSLAGIKIKQDAMALAEGKPVPSGIMANIFDNQPKQQQGYAPQQQAPQTPQAQQVPDFDNKIGF